MKKSHEAVEGGAALSCRTQVKGCGFRRSNLFFFFFLPLLIVNEPSSCSGSSLGPRAAPSAGI